LKGLGKRRIVVAISGASGSIYGARLLEALDLRSDVEVHLVATEWGLRTLALETGLTLEDLAPHCREVHPNNDLGASIASGSFGVDGMAIVPCSVKTLSSIATGYAASLVTRAADVALKERRPLVLVVRETPLSVIHLRNMLAASEAGATILPPMPAFYGRPDSLDAIVDHTVGQIMRHLGLESDLGYQWRGMEEGPKLR
jgi:4-hydroxy-3-polyprenylbenzoate decarboxylase